MAIFGVGYRGLEYVPITPWRRPWPIAWQEFRVLFRFRLGTIGYLLCLLPMIVSLAIMAARSGAWQLGRGGERVAEMTRFAPRLDPMTPQFYLDPVLRESFLIFLLLTSLVSCRAIAKDRATEALEIYWTRGITPWGYFLGKWLGSALLLGSVFVLATLLVWVLGVLTAPDWQLFQTTVHFVPRVLLGFLLMTLVLSYIAVGFSALARTPNIATIFWFCLVLGSGAIGRALARFFRGEWQWKAIAPWDAAKRLVEWVAGFPPRQNYDPGYAIAALATIILVLTLLLWRRLRLVEAIA